MVSAKFVTNTFKSKLGILLSCLGAAVGTGNIWRYPRIVANNTGENGALGFILVWFLCLFTWSIPMLIIEYGVGRYTKYATIMSFHKLVGPKSLWCGGFIGVVTLAISSYYSVICGWCIYYCLYYIMYALPITLPVSQEVFFNFTEKSTWPIFFQAIVIASSGFCVYAGVRSIEPTMLIIVPLLLLIMLVSLVYALTLPFASIGITHLFSMDWTVLNKPGTWIDALTQNAWDTGAGSGVLLVYATYFGKKHGVVKYGTVIPALNNTISLLMVITMFSTVFSVQASNDSTLTVANILESFLYNGPANTGLTFIWIPLLYSTLPIGRFLTIFFFLCLFLAAFSSQVGMIEEACHQLSDVNVTRKVGVPFISVLTFILGLGSAINSHFLANQDYVWGSAMILSGFFLLFLVIYFGVDKFRDEIVNSYGDGSDWKLPRIWKWIIKICLPIQVVCTLAWWFGKNISDTTKPWYKVTEDTVLSAILQWFLVIFVLALINIIYVIYEHKILQATTGSGNNRLLAYVFTSTSVTDLNSIQVATSSKRPQEVATTTV